MTGILNKVQQRKTIHCHNHKIHFATGGDAAWDGQLCTAAVLDSITRMQEPIYSITNTVCKGSKVFSGNF